MNDDFVDYKVNDNVQVFIDMANHNNCWCMNNYIEYNQGVPYQKSQLYSFKDKNQLEMFLKENYNGYKIGYSRNDKVTIHYVKYDMVKCNIDIKNDELSSVLLMYQEYINGEYIEKSYRFPKEYEKFVLSIIEDKSKVKKFYSLHGAYHQPIKRDTKENSVTLLTVGDFFGLISDKVKRMSPNTIKNLKRFVSVAALITLLTGGVSLIRSKGNKPIIITKSPTKSEDDLYITRNNNKASTILDKLIRMDYDSITSNELYNIIEYIEKLETANYDKNMSFSLYDFQEYFNNSLSDYRYSYDYNIISTQQMMNKVNTLYRSCFMEKNGHVVIDKDKAEKYINYVASLTFAYNTYVGPDKTVTERNIDSRFANKNDIMIYDNMPPILKIIILNQLKNMIDEVDFKIESGGKYYFGANNETAMIQKIDQLLYEATKILFADCDFKYQKNSHK